LNTQYAPKPSTQTAILFHDRQTFFGIFVNHVARTRFLRWDMIESWFDQAHYACGVFFHKDESLWLLDLDAIYLYLFTNYPSDILLSLKPTQQESIHTNPHCHIAIIDDSSCQRRILSNALSQHAFESKSFNSGTDFLKAQKDEWTPYAAIIIDVEMPRVSGIELEKILRSDSRYHATPMIFWTSISDKYLERQDLKARRTYFVAKFDLETLIKTIQTCVTIPLLQAHP
jgi:CheY-like chemotaxis protein